MRTCLSNVTNYESLSLKIKDMSLIYKDMSLVCLSFWGTCPYFEGHVLILRDVSLVLRDVSLFFRDMPSFLEDTLLTIRWQSCAHTVSKYQFGTWPLVRTLHAGRLTTMDTVLFFHTTVSNNHHGSRQNPTLRKSSINRVSLTFNHNAKAIIDNMDRCKFWLWMAELPFWEAYLYRNGLIWNSNPPNYVWPIVWWVQIYCTYRVHTVPHTSVSLCT